MCMSFDVIGPLTKNVGDAKYIFDIIKGHDNFDTTTKIFEGDKIKNNYVVGLVDVDKFAMPEIAKLIKDKTEAFAKKYGCKIKKVSLPLDILLETYYLLVYVEFFSTTRKYDGRRFGKRIEDAAGQEVLRRIFGGSEISKAEYKGRYYYEALKAKQYIKNKFLELFENESIDLIVLPTVPRTAHKIGEDISVEEMYAYDIFTTPANIAGIPGISVPAGQIDKKQIGLQILAPHFCEERLFDCGQKFE